MEKKDVKMAVKLIEAMSSEWKPANYRDTYTDRVEQLVEAKRNDEEVVEESKADAAEKVTDLMEALQASLEGTGKHRPGNRKRGGKLKTQKADAEDLGARSKEELYELAQELDIRGRSKMSQAELAKAIEKAGSKGRRKAS